MNILAFDTCFGACSVAVGVDIGLASEQLEEFDEPRDLGHAEALMPMINSAMNGAGIGFKDLDRIAVTIGPGSFTGTRICVSAARALSLATGVEVVGASSLAVMAEEAADSLSAERGDAALAVAVDARRGQVYVQQFGRNGLEFITPPQVMTVSDAATLGGPGPLLIVGSGAEAVAEAARLQGRSATARMPRLQPDACSLLYMAPHLKPIGGSLHPLYLREADAKPPSGQSIARI